MTIYGKTIKLLSAIGLGLLSCLFINAIYINYPANAASNSVDVVITVENYEEGKTYGGFIVSLYDENGSRVGYSQVADQKATTGDHIITAKITTDSTPSNDYNVCFGKLSTYDNTKATCGSVSYIKPDLRSGISGGYQARLSVGQDILTSKYFITASIIIEKTADDSSTYGPLDIDLIANDSSVSTKSTLTRTSKTTSVTLDFDEQFGVNDNSATYKICISDSDKCSDSQKFASGENVLELTIKLTAEEYKSFIKGDTTPTCGSEVVGIGWIVCPLINGLTTLNDGVWSLVKGLLIVNPLTQGVTSDDQSGSIYTAWGSIRNIANILFGIGFLIIIFSQMTSIGISNYGVKKLLPRLIVVAILVNISFIIMQVAVDLANIVGTSLYSLILGATPDMDLSWGALMSLISAGLVGGGLTAGAIIFAGGPTALFLMILPAALVGALGILAAIFTLMFRQAVIPVLAVLAPLAFVAMLLPNTESLFKTWKKLLIKMLVLYPLAAIIFGGAQFAAAVIAGDRSNWWNYLIGLIVLSAPLFSLPFIAAKGGAITDAVGGSLKNLAKAAKKPIYDGFKDRQELARSKYLNPETGKRMGLLQRTSMNRALNRETRLTDTKTNALGLKSRWSNSLAGKASTESLINAETQAKDDENKAAIRQYRSATGKALNEELGKSKLSLHTEESLAGERLESNPENTGLIQRSRLAEMQLKKAQTLSGKISAEAAAGPIDASAQRLVDLRVDTTEATNLATGFHEAQRGIDISTAATASANNVGRQEFNAEVATGGPLTEQVAGIDVEYGIPRAQATAIASIGKESDINVAAAKSLFTSEGYDSTQLLNAVIGGPDGKGVLKDNQTPPTNEQMEAALESAVETGYFPNLEAIYNTLTERARIADASGIPDKQTEMMQKALGGLMQKKKATTMPGAIIGELLTGKAQKPYGELIKATIESGKLSKTSITTLSAEELSSISSYISTNRDNISQESLKTLEATISQTLGDERVSADLSPLQIKSLQGITQIINP